VSLNLPRARKIKGKIYEWSPHERDGGGMFVFLVIREDNIMVEILPLVDTTTYNLSVIQYFSTNSAIDLDSKPVV
jgi:hypothetical protein